MEGHSLICERAESCHLERSIGSSSVLHQLQRDFSANASECQKRKMAVEEGPFDECRTGGFR